MLRLYWQAGREILARKKRHAWSLRETEHIAAMVAAELEPLRCLSRSLTEPVSHNRGPRQTTRITEAVEDLEALRAAFDDARRQGTPDQFYVSGFHSYDICVRELLAALNDEGEHDPPDHVGGSVAPPLRSR
ncbi:hypothetical protein [Myceligenerans indicum]|nr:hypothetical protein [Myceligenerans indicum]